MSHEKVHALGNSTTAGYSKQRAIVFSEVPLVELSKPQ
jgi:hypothetical protein